MSAQTMGKLPIRMGTDKEFDRVATALKDAQFNEETILRIFKIERMSDVNSPKPEDVDLTGVSPQLRTLIQLFLHLKLVPRPEVEAALERATVDAFVSLGLISREGFGVDHYHATILLYPVAGFLMVSDRHSNPDGSPFDAPPDIVFPAIFGGTLRFLELLPRRPGTDALDLCAGSGIGAFLLSRFNRRAVSSDITQRATNFAAFNRALNKLENVEVVCGDLYEAVKDRTFDRIVAHPPYVPSLEVAAIWRDGGTTGEFLVRKIIEGVAERLRAGGIFFMLSLGLDTKEGRFEERARSWLGDVRDEFDIIFAAAHERVPSQVLRDIAERDDRFGVAGMKRLEQVLEKAGVVKMPYGALMLQRHAVPGEHKPWTLRTRMSEATDPADFEQAFQLHRYFEQPGAQKSLAQAKLRLAPRLQVKVTHVVHEGTLVPGEYIFETDKPFDVMGELDGWLVPLILRFDGTTTAAEAYEAARSEGQLPEGFGLGDFTAMLERMIERGYLLLPSSGQQS